MSEEKQTYGNTPEPAGTYDVFADFKQATEQAVENANKTDQPEGEKNEQDAKQQTRDWFMSRIGKFTGSVMPDFMKGGRGGNPWGETAKKIIYRIVAERSMIADGLDQYVDNLMKKDFLQTRWGNDFEAEALQAFSEMIAGNVETTGFSESMYDFFGSSVDGILVSLDGNRYPVEIKCPFDPIKHEVNMGLPQQVTEKNDYWWQMQSHNLVQNSEKCYFVSYDPRRAEPDNLKIMVCHRDAEAIEKLQWKLEKGEEIVQHRLKTGEYDFDL